MALWLFNGAYMTGYNLLRLPHRRDLRIVLMGVAFNALLLSIFGTLQNLSHSTGIFFNTYATPQEYFFASFVYRNHWGAYVLLALGALLGIIGHSLKHAQGRNIWHTPVTALSIGVLCMLLTLPLSGARICSLLGMILLLLALSKLFAGLKHHYQSAWREYACAGVLALAVIGSAGWYLSKDVIQVRSQTTFEQWTQMKTSGIGGRAALYRDTWHMAHDRVLFGWGMGSYPVIFYRYNQQKPSPIDHLPVYYHDAHSDWLQSVSEIGLIGTLLIVACALVPMLLRPRSGCLLSQFVLTGLGLVLLYALVEFPFGNLAVVVHWWILFFIAVRYMQLRYLILHKPDEDPMYESRGV
jgi:O-antigen ligase